MFDLFLKIVEIYLMNLDEALLEVRENTTEVSVDDIKNIRGIVIDNWDNNREGFFLGFVTIDFTGCNDKDDVAHRIEKLVHLIKSIQIRLDKESVYEVHNYVPSYFSFRDKFVPVYDDRNIPFKFVRLGFRCIEGGIITRKSDVFIVGEKDRS